MLALLEQRSMPGTAGAGRMPMPDPLDDVRYYAERIGVAEAQAAHATSLTARLAHDTRARLYRERLVKLLQGPLDPDAEDKRA